MNTKKHSYLFILCVCCALAKAQIPSAWLKTFEQNKAMKQASLGFQVVEISSGKILAEHQSHLALIPASTLKVVTTSSSLCMLGKNYSYSTKILSTAKADPKLGIINGDIIIKGNGDPSLQSSYFYKDSNSVCTSWALALKKLGIKTITGNCIGDASYFSKSINPNWIWGDIGNYFGASFNGLSFHDNKFSVFFTSGNLGTKATVSNIEPNYIKLPISIISSVVAKGSEDEAYVYGDPNGFTKDVNGNIPPNKSNYEVEAALPDPALLCAESFAKALKKENIAIDEKKCQSLYQKTRMIQL